MGEDESLAAKGSEERAAQNGRLHPTSFLLGFAAYLPAAEGAHRYVRVTPTDRLH